MTILLQLGERGEDALGCVMQTRVAAPEKQACLQAKQPGASEIQYARSGSFGTSRSLERRIVRGKSL